MQAMKFGDTIMVTEWEKGDVLKGTCDNCGKEILLLLNFENRDDELHNRFIKCECGKEYQVIL